VSRVFALSVIFSFFPFQPNCSEDSNRYGRWGRCGRSFPLKEPVQIPTFREHLPVQLVDATPRVSSEVLLKQEVLGFSGFLQNKS
jgi:hypothetical protein